MPKNYVPRSKTVTCSLRTDKQTNRQTPEWKLSTYRGSAFQASAYDLSGPTCARFYLRRRYVEVYCLSKHHDSLHITHNNRDITGLLRSFCLSRTVTGCEIFDLFRNESYGSRTFTQTGKVSG